MPSPLKYRTVLLRCARLLSEEFNQILLPHQLNYSLWQVIYFIHDQSEVNSIDVSKYLKVSKPSIAKRVQTLMQLDLLQQVSTADKRQKNLVLTPHGLELFETCSLQIDQYEQKLLSDFGKEQLEQSFNTLSQLLAHLQQPKPQQLEIDHE